MLPGGGSCLDDTALADAARIHIDALAQIQEPEPPYVVLTPPRLRLRAVYVGSAADEAKYKAIETFTRSHLSMPNPFLQCSEPGSSLPPAPASPSSNQERYHPCS